MSGGRERGALLGELLLLPIVVVFFAYVDIHLYHAGAMSFPAVYLFIVALSGVAGWVFVRGAMSRALAARTVALYAAHAQVVMALAAIILVSFALSFLPGAYWGEGPRYVVFPVYDAITLLLSMLLPLAIAPERLHRLLVCAFAVFATSVLIDAVFPGTFSVLAERAAGFAGNPNTAAFLVIAFCCTLLRFDGARAGEIAVLTLAAAAILATLSRGGLVMFAYLLLWYGYGALRMRDASPGRRSGRRRWRSALALGLLVVAIGGAGATLLRGAQMFTLQSQTRATMLEGDQEFVTTEDPRYALLMEAVALVGEAPLLGRGSGFTWSLPEGPHNIYLTQWVNNGLPGLAAYMWLILAAAALFRARRSRPGLAFIGAVALEGLFSHNLLDERAFLAFLGVQLTLSYESAQRRRAESAQAADARFAAGAGGPVAARSAPRIRTRVVNQG